eukprot:GDKJ01049638.1.p1 GENE.GDKJ01049638.1~~GDKJ01049638.1.p1  ORF type:complete len:388 (-),score=73.75 GDKJ01049638.1:994-2157(-)
MQKIVFCLFKLGYLNAEVTSGDSNQDHLHLITERDLRWHNHGGGTGMFGVPILMAQPAPTPVVQIVQRPILVDPAFTTQDNTNADLVNFDPGPTSLNQFDNSFTPDTSSTNPPTRPSSSPSSTPSSSAPSQAGYDFYGASPPPTSNANASNFRPLTHLTPIFNRNQTNRFFDRADRLGVASPNRLRTFDRVNRGGVYGGQQQDGTAPSPSVLVVDGEVMSDGSRERRTFAYDRQSKSMVLQSVTFVKVPVTYASSPIDVSASTVSRRGAFVVDVKDPLTQQLVEQRVFVYDPVSKSLTLLSIIPSAAPPPLPITTITTTTKTMTNLQLPPPKLPPVVYSTLLQLMPPCVLGASLLVSLVTMHLKSPKPLFKLHRLVRLWVILMLFGL